MKHENESENPNPVTMIGGYGFKPTAFEVAVERFNSDWNCMSTSYVRIKPGLYGWTISTSRGGGMSRSATYRWTRDGEWKESIGDELKACFTFTELDEEVPQAISGMPR